jgi:hypothetical protein
MVFPGEVYDGRVKKTRQTHKIRAAR